MFIHLRKILLAFLVFAAAATAAFAGPALQTRVSLAQPDGERFYAVKRGDEFINWYETEDNYAVLMDEATDYWVFAKVSSSGGLLPMEARYSAYVAAPVGAAKNFIPSSATMERLKIKYTNGSAYSKASTARTEASDETTWTSNPVSGKREAIFIRVNFQDVSFDSTIEKNKKEIWGDSHSVRRYYLDQSHGKLDIVSADFGTGGKKDIIEITMTSADYNGGMHPDRLLSSKTYSGDYVISHKNEVAFVTSVLRRTGLDYAQFDKNGDGSIEADELVVYLLLAGYEESNSMKRPAIWMHAWRSFVSEGDEHIVFVSDDKSTMLAPWSCGGELVNALVGSQDVVLPLVGGIVHELGHQLCRLPDLYDVNYVNRGLGAYSVMAGGSWGFRVGAGEIFGATPPNLDAWSRKYLGWDAPHTLTLGSARTSFICGTPRNALFPVVRINSPRVDSTYEYILAEVRNPNASDWDGGLSGVLADKNTAWPESFSGGMLLLHIDERVGSGSLKVLNDFNAYTKDGHQGNMGIWANGDSRAKGAGQGSYKSLWYEGNGTAPDTNFYGSRDVAVASAISGISISAFSPSGEFVSAVTSRTDTGGGGCSAALFPLLLLAGALPIALKKR